MSYVPESAFSVGQQPCDNFVGVDELVDRGVRGNRHECFGPWPVEPGVERCGLLVSLCANCHSDHHQDGRETCRPSVELMEAER